MNPAKGLQIGTKTFDLIESPDAHTIEQQAFGPTGPVDLSMRDWGAGLQLIDQGTDYQQTPQILSSDGVDTAFPGQAIIQPEAVSVAISTGSLAGNPIKFAEFGTYVYLIQEGRYVLRSTGGAAFTLARDLGVGKVATDVVVHGGKIGVAYGTGYDWSSDGSSWTPVATAADRFGVAGDKLYRAVRPNTVFAGTGSFDGGWDAGTGVGDSGWNINSLYSMEQVLMVGKEDGLYAIDQDGGVSQQTPELRLQPSTEMATVRAISTFNGDFYFKTPLGMVTLAAENGLKNRVGIDRLATPDLPTPVIRSLVADDRYLYALLDNTSGDTYVLRRTTRGAWHVYWRQAGAGRAHALGLASSAVMSGFIALWLAQGGPPAAISYLRLSNFPNPLQDSNYHYWTSNVRRMRLPRFGTAEQKMLIDRCTILSLNLAAGVTITPFVSVDGGAITQFGTAGASSSPYSTIIPATAVFGNFFDFYLEFSTNSNITTPILKGVTFKGVWLPQYRFVHTFRLMAERGTKVRRGGTAARGVYELLGDIESLESRTSPQYYACVDELGTQFNAVVVDVRERFAKWRTANEPSYAVEVQMMEQAANL